MKNIVGKLIGFAVGAAGFLFLFKIIILDKTTPEDELAPGMVVILAALCGVLFGYLGNLLQDYFAKKSV